MDGQLDLGKIESDVLKTEKAAVAAVAMQVDAVLRLLAEVRMLRARLVDVVAEEEAP